MKRQNIWIFVLMLFTGMVYAFLSLIVIPEIRLRESLSKLSQQDAMYHDITAIQKYRSPYLGNASNTGNLFYNLPMLQYPMTFAIDPDSCTLTVRYDVASEEVGLVRENLAYNTVAAMAAIDNLERICYVLTDAEYTFTREQVEAHFGTPLAPLLDDPDQWRETMDQEIFQKASLEEWFPTTDTP